MIEIISEIKQGWAEYIKAISRHLAGPSLGVFWLPTAASGGVWGQIPPSRMSVDFDRFIKTHLFKQMADAPSALGSSFLSNSTREGHHRDTKHLLHHPRAERGEGPEIKKKKRGGSPGSKSDVTPLHGNSLQTCVCAPTTAQQPEKGGTTHMGVGHDTKPTG